MTRKRVSGQASDDSEEVTNEQTNELTELSMTELNYYSAWRKRGEKL